MTNALTLTAGMKIEFTYDGSIFELAKVTDKNVSWYVAPHKGGTGKNNLKMTHTSLKRFLGGIDRGAYKIVDHGKK